MGTIVAVLKDGGTKSATADVRFTGLSFVDSTVLVASIVLQLSRLANVPVTKIIDLITEGLKKGA